MSNITFLENHFLQLKSHLFPGDGKEAVAICLARQIKKADRVKFLITEVHPIPYEKCDRSADFITWSSSDIVDLIDRAETEELSIIKVHSHPCGLREFSSQDDRSDYSLFPALQNWCGTKNLHCSVVLTEDFVLGRMFDFGTKSFAAIENIFVIGDRLRLFSGAATGSVECAFDDLTYEIFKKLKIGLVGCSGTGSWIAELLGRNNVGKIVLCDFDLLTKLNLPRVLNAKLRHVGLNKALIAAEAIADMGNNSELEVVQFPVQDPRAIEALKDCDIVFGCVDSVFARNLIGTMCTYYMIPYFDVGVHINAGVKQLLSSAGGFHYLQPGKSTLMSRGVYSSKDLAEDTFKIFSPTHFERLKGEGYVHGRNASRPAVAGLNGSAATSCFNEFESLILNYLYADEDGFASKVFCKRSGEHFFRTEGSYKPDLIMCKKTALGDLFYEHEAHLIGQAKTSDLSQVEERK